MTQVLMDRATLEKALKLAFNLWQTYWAQADSDYVSQQNKSGGTREKFNQLITDTCAALANAEPAGWQPIETAPKDGRPILLFGDCRVTSGHWSAPSETPRIIYQDGFAPDTEWDEWEPYWASWDGGFTEEHPPTHWMPLPAAPKEQQ